jgi:hypothetical protein
VKIISKVLFVLIMGLMISTAFALEPTYKKTSLTSSSLKPTEKYSQVFLVNLTRENYMAYSVYKDTGRFFSIPLSATGTLQDHIQYPIDYPEYAVCLDVIQNYTGIRVYQGCLSTGTVYIHYAADNKTRGYAKSR